LLIDNRDKEKLLTNVVFGFGAFLGLFLLIGGIGLGFFPLIFIGAIVILIMVGMYSNKRVEINRDGYEWYKIISQTPEEIVWIMPVVTKHTVGLVVTLYKEQSFQIKTKDKVSLNVKCENQEDQLYLFYGLAKYLPNVHTGYTPEAKHLYDDDPTTMVDKLKERGKFNPFVSTDANDMINQQMEEMDPEEE
jgi:hypothetical protein